MKLVICYEVPLIQNRNGESQVQGIHTGDTYAEADTLNEQTLEGIRAAIRADIAKRFQGNNGIVLGRPVFRSVCRLSDSLIVAPRV